MSNFKNVFTLALVFLLPLFFLPTTQEFFIANKLYLLSFGGLLLLVGAVIQLFLSKKIVWRRSPFDLALSLFIITAVLTVLLTTPNRLEALLNPYFGLMMVLSLSIFYFVLTQNTNKKAANQHLEFFQYSGLVVAALTLLFFFNPFQNVSLPTQLTFLKTPGFSTIGSQLDLAIFLGFLLVLQVAYLIGKKNSRTGMTMIFLGVFGLAFSAAVYLLFRPALPEQEFLLTPLRNSWFAAIEVLKNPWTALFGAGMGNFAAVFTRVKDLAFNQSDLWQVSSFNISRSSLLHLFTETGILGFSAFAFLLFTLWKTLTKVGKDNPLRMALYFLSVYVFLALVFFPPSFITFFLLILTLYLVSSESYGAREIPKQEFDLKNLQPLLIALEFLLVGFVIVAGYFLGRAYLAEYYFKQSLDGYRENDLRKVYENQRQAIVMNPYVERFRISFSQTNLLLANNIASAGELNDEQKQQVAQAVQAAISEAKAATALNPQKSANWENLAIVYRNILQAVKGADAWAISSYQRAIQVDPLNPIYRVNLGGVYYAIERYSDALTFFKQATTLKPDWPNAHYNWAWASYKLQDFEKAVSEMEEVLKLIDKNISPQDYEKAQKELEQFKNPSPEDSQASPEGGLRLDAPLFDLPEATPEAN